MKLGIAGFEEMDKAPHISIKSHKPQCKAFFKISQSHKTLHKFIKRLTKMV